MAVKQAYKIPYDLDATYLDVEIALNSDKTGIGTKPLPIKVILTYVGSFVLLLFVISHSVVSKGFWWQQVMFALCWIGLTVLLASFDTTRQMKMQLIPTLMEYIPKTNRVIFTRRSNRANEFLRIAGIDHIDDDGCVYYTDGTFGYWYRVVGSASVLLFDDDKEAILNRVDSFYRKIGTDYEIIFETTKEAQKVSRQIEALKKRYDNLTVRDPELLELADNEYRVLKYYVGKQFKSIHQYMILKADNQEALTAVKNVLHSECDNSALMIKQCTVLYRDDINEALRVIYRGRDD